MTHMPLEFNSTERVLGHSLPHRRVEAWKWTNLREAVLDTAGGLTAEMNPQFDLPVGGAISRPELAPDNHAMSQLAAKFSKSVWMLTVPDGMESEINVQGLGQGHGRIAIKMGKGAKLRLTEYHNGQSGSFANIDVSVSLAENAHLTRIIVHDESEDVTRTVTAHMDMDKNARVDQFTLSFGSALSRFETRVVGKGEAVEANMNGAYLLSGNRHCDMTSHVQLGSSHAVIRQAIKGVVTDEARGVFQGKFHVERPAQHTDAEMRHDALMLSDTAQIRSKPELEIYADDVACAHGNTIGQLDESALFYMRQRGIPQAQARALLTQAFVADVFDDVGDEALKELILGNITDWL